MMAVVQVQNVCDPTNTANVWVANFTGVPIDTITKRTLPFQIAVAVAATLAVAVASPALFGVRAFAPADSGGARRRAIAPAGILRARARRAAGSRSAATLRRSPRAAAAAVVGALDGKRVARLRFRDDPNARDCAHKAVRRVRRTSRRRVLRCSKGTDFDVGLRLEDCGGWIVDEWHDHAVVAGSRRRRSTRARSRWPASLGCARGRQRNPVRSANLFATGVGRGAARQADATSTRCSRPSTETCGSTSRPAVPRYAAGLRSGDVVNKIDGKYWWEYGTYQTQQRAYDGKPHAFEIERGGKTLDVAVGRTV